MLIDTKNILCRNIFKVKDWNKKIFFIIVLKTQLIETLFSEKPLLLFLPGIIQSICIKVVRPSIPCYSFRPAYYNLFIFPVICYPRVPLNQPLRYPSQFLKYTHLTHVVKWVSSSSNLRLSFVYAPWWHQRQQQDPSEDEKTSKAWAYPMTVNGTRAERVISFWPMKPDYFFTCNITLSKQHSTQIIISHKLIHKNCWESK